MVTLFLFSLTLAWRVSALASAAPAVIAPNACGTVSCFDHCANSWTSYPGNRCKDVWVSTPGCWRGVGYCEGDTSCGTISCFDHCSSSWTSYPGNSCRSVWVNNPGCWREVGTCR